MSLQETKKINMFFVMTNFVTVFQKRGTKMNYNNFWDNVLKQEEWNDELKRWENTHPEYQPFKEDSDSQRQQNK